MRKILLLIVLLCPMPVAAQAWTATPTIVNGHVELTAIGALGATVDWAATNDDTLCMLGVFPS